MPTVTITGAFRTLDDKPDAPSVQFEVPEVRIGPDGSTVITTRFVAGEVNQTTGIMVPLKLQPGPAELRIGGNSAIPVVIPSSDTSIASLLYLGGIEPPAPGADFVVSVGGMTGIVAADTLAAAISPYLTAGVTLAQVNAIVDALKGGVAPAYDTLVEIVAKLDADDTALAGLLASIADRYTKAQSDSRFLSKTDAAASYAPLAQGVPTSGSTGQVLTKTASGFAFQAAPSGGSSGVVDNGDGTATISSSFATDNGDGTATLS